jgi:hypothetical protein
MSIMLKYQIHENPSSGSPVFPGGQTDREADMTELITVFSSFANAPKNLHIALTEYIYVFSH